MKSIGSAKPMSMSSTESLIWQAQAAAKEIELSAKRDLAIKSRSKFDEAIQARRKAADARFAKGQKENKSSFWSTVGMICGAGVAVLVAALAPISAPLLLGAVVTLFSMGVTGAFGIAANRAWDGPAKDDELNASENDIRATQAQKESDDAKEEAQAAQDRFRAILDDAKTMDQTRLRAFQKD